MKALFFLALITHIFFDTNGADLKYAVRDIPEGLKQDVNRVIREDHMTFTIFSKSRASHKVHYVVTILNSKGSGSAKLTLGYDKLSKIADFNATVYDENGKQIKRLKNNEINDHAAYDGYSLFSDDRLKSVDMTQATYPYTVEFEYEIEYKYLYFIPGSEFGGEKVSTEHASYKLIYPLNLAPRYKVLNMVSAPKADKLSDGMESLTWTLENIKPMKFEPNGPPEEDLVPRIEAAPTSFEYDGYAGNMSSWKEYGKWNSLLNRDRDVLPEKTKRKVHELTQDLSTTEQKAKVLYEYLQSKTRYVSIQLGIGGNQPFPASVVDETGYGDCKALSNYMVAMLKEVGIKGYYTTIMAGRDEPDVIVDFPSHQANHIIVSVPNGKDTLWMECTSQTKSFGYMGTFTGDRYALMVTDEGGKLVRTPAYSAEQNSQFRTVDAVLDAQGNAKAKVKTTYSGTQSENGGLDQLMHNQYEDQKKWVQANTDIPNFNVNTFSLKAIKNKIPSVVVTLDLMLNRYASVNGKRVFISPNMMNKISFIPEKIEARKTDVVMRSNYLDVDTVTIHFPENLYPEFLPPPMKVTSRFGEYEASFKFGEGELIYIRKMKALKGRYPKESYNEFVEFYKNVNKFDNLKLVFLNKT